MSQDMTKVIARINELAAKKKSGQKLTEQELIEKKKLYKIYLSVIRGNLAAQLDNIEVVEENPKTPGEYQTIWEGKNVKKANSESTKH